MCELFDILFIMIYVDYKLPDELVKFHRDLDRGVFNLKPHPHREMKNYV